MVATVTAGVGLLVALRQRPSIQVHVTLVFAPVSQEEATEAKGTVVDSKHGPQEVLLGFQIVNRGRRALEIVGVVVEGTNETATGFSKLVEIRPHPLPIVLEPLTSVRPSIQKEFLDITPRLQFLGVVDALGNRHPAVEEDIRRVLSSNADLPSKLRSFRPRADPDAAAVKAFQVQAPFTVTNRPLDRPAKRSQRHPAKK